VVPVDVGKHVRREETPRRPQQPGSAWPQRDAPPPVLPADHPSAPLPRFGPNPSAPPQSRAYFAGYRAARFALDVWDEVAAIRRAAERDAAVIRRQGADRAAAIRRAAEQDAAELRSELTSELRSALRSTSPEPGQVAACITDFLAEHHLRVQQPEDWPTAGDLVTEEPLTRSATSARTAIGVRPANRRLPGRPQPVPPSTKPTGWPGAKPAGQQAAAMRMMLVAFVALVIVALIAGATGIALPGLGFSVFRWSSTSATDSNGLQEDHGPGQPDAPAAHHSLMPKAQPSTSASATGHPSASASATGQPAPPGSQRRRPA
jgi:hypothetical protein